MATATKKAAVVEGARLRVLYTTTIAKELQTELGLKNPHQVPKLDKIVINVGLGRAKDDKRIMEIATNTLRLKVTLRGERMYEFADRLISIVLPRLRDFHGVSAKAFDRQGNFSLGMIDQSVFPELSFEETTTPHGLQAVFVINCEDKSHARALLEKFGMPFEKENN
jgi:large subunit ribosomal protein L5